MSKMDELYSKMSNFCDENGCWKTWMTVKDWNECISGEYSSASYTALVNAGRLERRKKYKATSYEYHIIPTEKIKERLDEEKKRSDIERAEWIVAHYEEQIALRRAQYEEMIKQAEEQLARDLEWEAKKLADAKAVLEN
jgi:hypothetical protein